MFKFSKKKLSSLLFRAQMGTLTEIKKKSGNSIRGVAKKRKNVK